jgi:hypothetical protein
MSKTCLNCGREHEGRLVETFTDGDGRAIEIVVCEQARHETMTIDEFWRQHV